MDGNLMNLICSRELMIYIKANIPDSRELSLADFLTEEAIEKFGVKAQFLSKKDPLEIKYKCLKKSKCGGESLVKEITAKVSSKEKITLVYMEFGLRINTIDNTLIYQPDFKFTHKLFFLLNTIKGFKQADFRDYYTKILNFPKRVFVMPSVFNRFSFYGKEIYMFKEEAEKYLDSYYVRLKEYLHASETGDNEQRKNYKCSVGCRDYDNFPSTFFDCERCLLKDVF